MKIVRATKKLDKAIDALIDLQQDFMDELVAAEVVYDVEIALDTIRRIGTAIDSLS